jgi:hypothetical protein
LWANPINIQIFQNGKFLGTPESVKIMNEIDCVIIELPKTKKIEMNFLSEKMINQVIPKRGDSCAFFTNVPYPISGAGNVCDSSDGSKIILQTDLYHGSSGELVLNETGVIGIILGDYSPFPESFPRYLKSQEDFFMTAKSFLTCPNYVRVLPILTILEHEKNEKYKEENGESILIYNL